MLRTPVSELGGAGSVTGRANMAFGSGMRGTDDEVIIRAHERSLRSVERRPGGRMKDVELPTPVWQGAGDAERSAAAPPGSAGSSAARPRLGVNHELEALQLGEQPSGLGQGVGQDRLGHFQELEDPRIGHRVANRRAFFSGLAHVRPPKDPELPGETRRFETDLRDQLADRSLSVP